MSVEIKNLLITGGSGLVGSHLLGHLEGKGFNLHTVSSSLGGPGNIPVDFSQEWDTALLPAPIDAVIHLSQHRGFRDFPAKAKEVFYVNTLSTLKLVDWAVKNGVKKFIYASSAGVYGNSESLLKEDQPLIYKKEQGFYLGTKFCSEIILDNFSSLLDIIQLRFIFVYGKGQQRNMLIPRLVDNIKNNIALTLQGEDGFRTNPVHVSDAVKAITAALTVEGSHKFNIGGNEVLSLKKIGEIIGTVLRVSPTFTNQPGPAMDIVGDISKMKQMLVTPVVPFAEGIKDLL